MTCSITKLKPRFYLIRLTDGDELVGTLRFDHLLSVEIGAIEVVERFRGKGYSHLLYQALKDYCLENYVSTVDGSIIHPAAAAARKKVFGNLLLQEHICSNWYTSFLPVDPAHNMMLLDNSGTYTPSDDSYDPFADD